MNKMYKTTFNEDCCLKETENCGDIQIEGFPLYSGMQNCLVVYCRECWNKTYKPKQKNKNKGVKQ